MRVKAIHPYYKVFALMAFALTTVPTIIFYSYYISSDFFFNNESEVLITFVTPLLIQFSGIPSEAVTTIAIVLPAWLSAVALCPEQERLNRTQKIGIAILTFSIVLNLSTVILFSDVDNVVWEERLIHGSQFIPKLIQGADSMYKSGFAYLLFILGLHNQMEKENAS